jgi:dTDP-glucose 4,6-dehydratase
LERELGWKAEESFETGLEKTVIWYLNNRQWWQSIQRRGYSGDRVGMAPAGAAPN